jgi:hypothetical protein
MPRSEFQIQAITLKSRSLVTFTTPLNGATPVTRQTRYRQLELLQIQPLEAVSRFASVAQNTRFSQMMADEPHNSLTSLLLDQQLETELSSTLSPVELTLTPHPPTPCVL